MRVLVKRVGEKAEIIEIEEGLEAMQEIVEGYIEPISLGNGIYLICNEDGQMVNKPYNFSLRGFPIVGNVFFAKLDRRKNDYTSLTEKEAQTIKEQLEFS